MAFKLVEEVQWLVGAESSKTILVHLPNLLAPLGQILDPLDTKRLEIYIFCITH